MNSGRMLTADNYECTWGSLPVDTVTHSCGQDGIHGDRGVQRRAQVERHGEAGRTPPCQGSCDCHGFSMHDRLELLKLSRTAEDSALAPVASRIGCHPVSSKPSSVVHDVSHRDARGGEENHLQPVRVTRLALAELARRARRSNDLGLRSDPFRSQSPRRQMDCDRHPVSAARAERSSRC